MEAAKDLMLMKQYNPLFPLTKKWQSVGLLLYVTGRLLKLNEHFDISITMWVSKVR